MDRHDRQARLADVGSAGQARIAAATVSVSGHSLAAEMAIRYLAGAGVGCLRVADHALAGVARSIDPAARVAVVAEAASRQGDDGAESATHRCDDSDLRDPIAREAARGARVAVRALRRALDGTSAAPAAWSKPEVAS